MPWQGLMTALVRTTITLVLVSGVISACASQPDGEPTDPPWDGLSAESALVLDNGVTRTIDGVNQKLYLYRFEVPEGQTFLRVETNGRSIANPAQSGADLYVRHEAIPTRSRLTAREFLREGPANEETIEPPPLAGTWYALIAFDGSYNELHVTATWNDTDVGTRILKPGTAITGIDAATDEAHLFYLEVPPKKSDLSFKLSAQTGKPAFCLGMGLIPDAAQNANCVRYGFDEIRPGDDAEGGWLVAVTAADGPITGGTLVASYSNTPAGQPASLPAGDGTKNITLKTTGPSYYVVDMPPDTISVRLKVHGPKNGTMLVRKGELPTQYLNASNEDFGPLGDGEFTMSTPAAGPWYIRLNTWMENQTVSLETMVD
ncbi:MAG: PPC domain-containing protein [Kofleriaceae bacterium]